jgi:hypothetical protein
VLTCARVILEAEAVRDARGDSVNVLQRPGQFDADRVLPDVAVGADQREDRFGLDRQTSGTKAGGTDPMLAERALPRAKPRTLR